MSIEVITGPASGSTTAQDAIALSPDAALIVDPAGASAVVDMSGSFYGISAIGAEMLKGALTNGRRQTAEAMARRFGVAVERVATDMEQLIGRLQANGAMLASSSARSPRAPLGARLGAGAVAGIVRLAGRSRLRARIALKAARLSFALFGWRATVDAWRSRFPATATPSASTAEQARAIDTLVRGIAARDMSGSDCKERALTCFALARAAGLPASLHVGVALYPLGGHCWCRVGDVVVSDDKESCDRFLPVFCYA
jgi:hypothetical protein